MNQFLFFTISGTVEIDRTKKWTFLFLNHLECIGCTNKKIYSFSYYVDNQIDISLLVP